MPTPYFAVFDDAGNLQSTGSSVADELPDGWTVQDVPEPPPGPVVLDQDALQWVAVEAVDPPALTVDVPGLSEADIDRIAAALAEKLRGD